MRQNQNVYEHNVRGRHSRGKGQVLSKLLVARDENNVFISSFEHYMLVRKILEHTLLYRL